MADVFIRPFAPSEGYDESDVLLYPFEADGTGTVVMKNGGAILVGSAGAALAPLVQKAAGGQFTLSAGGPALTDRALSGGGILGPSAGGPRAPLAIEREGGAILGTFSGGARRAAARVVRLRVRLRSWRIGLLMAKLHVRAKATRTPSVETDSAGWRVEPTTEAPLVIEATSKKSPDTEIRVSIDRDPREEC